MGQEETFHIQHVYNAKGFKVSRSFYWPDVIPVANQQPQSGERVTPCISHL